MYVPFFEPSFSKEEVTAVTKVIREGWVSQGKEIEEFERKLARFLGVKYVITVNSGTAALEIAQRALGIEKKEVITTVTSVAPTTNAIIHSGNKPIFVDVSIKDYNIDTRQVEKHITKNTAVIMPVHLYGKPCNMDEIMEISEKYNITVIEDCAQSLGAKWKEKKTGTFGKIGCFSLNITKLITTGQGGFIATNDKKVALRASIIRNYGLVAKPNNFYNYDLFGHNFKLTNFQAALGLVQLKKIHHFIRARRRIAREIISSLENEKNIQVPCENKNEFISYFCVPILLKKQNRRNKVCNLLYKKGIEAFSIFKPICAQPYFEKLYGKTDFNNLYPNATYVSDNGFVVGCYPGMSEEKLKYLIKGVKEALYEVM